MESLLKVVIMLMVAALITIYTSKVEAFAIENNGVYLQSDPLTGQIQVSKYQVQDDDDSDDDGDSDTSSEDSDAVTDDPGSVDSMEDADDSSNSTATTDNMSTTTEAETTTSTTAPTTTTIPTPQQTVTVEFVSITEIDNTSAVIGSMDAQPHTYTGFNAINFTVSNTMAQETTYMDLNASMLSLQHQMTGMDSASLEVTFYSLETGGTVTMNGASQTLTAGQVVMRVQLNGWAWCDTCAGVNGTLETGAGLLFVVSVMGSGTMAADPDVTNKYSLGTYQSIMVNNEVMIDNQWISAPDYPMLAMETSQATYHLEKFTTSASFDVVLNITLPVDSTTTGAAGCVHASLLVAIAMVIMGLFFAV